MSHTHTSLRSCSLASLRSGSTSGMDPPRALTLGRRVQALSPELDSPTPAELPVGTTSNVSTHEWTNDNASGLSALAQGAPSGFGAQPPAADSLRRYQSLRFWLPGTVARRPAHRRLEGSGYCNNWTAPPTTPLPVVSPRVCGKFFRRSAKLCTKVLDRALLKSARRKHGQFTVQGSEQLDRHPLQRTRALATSIEGLWWLRHLDFRNLTSIPAFGEFEKTGCL